MTVQFVLPESFDASQYLPARLSRRRDDANYLMSTILTKTARREVDGKGLVRLMGSFLSNIMAKDSYSDVIESLRANGAIERFPYSTGHAFGFRLNARFITDRHVRVEATDPRLIRRLETFHSMNEGEATSKLQPVHQDLAARQTMLSIDSMQAGVILARLPPESNPFDAQGILVSNIVRRDFALGVGGTGRVFNNITGLKRELRPTLRVQGQHLSSIDIVNAQPALLGATMHSSTTHHTSRHRDSTGQSKGKYDSDLSSGCHDAETYIKLVQAGEFYDFMTDAFKPKLSRTEIKKRFLVDVLAKKGGYPSPLENKFLELFPTVHRFVRSINATHHANLIRRLQVEESSLVIGRVAADFMVRNPDAFVISLHDAIYSTPGNLPALEQSFHRCFTAIDFPMKLKIEA